MRGHVGWWPPPRHQAPLSPSPQFSARLAEHSRQLAGVQNEYGFALVSATAHLEHYRRVELPAAMQVGAAPTPHLPPPGSHKKHLPCAAARGCSREGPAGVGVRDAPRGGQGCSPRIQRCSPGGGAGGAGGGFPPAFPQALDGDLYERLREHLAVASRTEVETCRATGDWFQGVAEASVRVTAPVPGAGGGGQEGLGEPPGPTLAPLLQVCREQDLLLFLQDHPAFALAPEQRFQLAGVEEVGAGGTLQRRGGGARTASPFSAPPSLPRCACCCRGTTGPAWRRRHGAGPHGWLGTAKTRRTARRWVLSFPTEHSGGRGGGLKEGFALSAPSPPISHRPTDLRAPTQELQRLEAKRQQVPEAEVATVERRMEEARENIRKAEVGPPQAGGLEICHPRSGGRRDGEARWLGM